MFWRESPDSLNFVNNNKVKNKKIMRGYRRVCAVIYLFFIMTFNIIEG